VIFPNASKRWTSADRFASPTRRQLRRRIA
jgi:hypothetical protein